MFATCNTETTYIYLVFVTTQDIKSWIIIIIKNPTLQLLEMIKNDSFKVLLTTNMVIHHVLSKTFCQISMINSSSSNSFLKSLQMVPLMYINWNKNLNFLPSAWTLWVIKHKDFLKSRHELCFMKRIKKIKCNFSTLKLFHSQINRKKAIKVGFRSR